MNRRVFFLIAFACAVPQIGQTQANPNFSGTWKLQKVDPPPAPPPGNAQTSGGGAGYDETAFGAPTQTLVITQSANEVTVQGGPTKTVYTLDNNFTVTPPNDVDAWKARAHWEAGTLHLHFKKGMNFGRDVLTVSGTNLSIQRDLESGGGSTTQMITYTKTS